MTVWLLYHSEGRDSGFIIYGVFSTEEKAKEAEKVIA